jgi:peptidoglycan/LPS O-acetylase OafA/YrhL
MIGLNGHRMAKNIVDRLIAPGGTSSAQIARLVLTVLLALLMAEVIYRLVERPMIQAGRRLARMRSLPAVNLGHA